MGLIRKLFGLTPTIGETRPICPYCSHDLLKMPGRKKSCPKCNKNIYVRTRPKDNAKILIREDDILAIEEQWAKKNGTHKEFLAAQHRRQTIVNALTKKFGRSPSTNDVEWAILNDDILTHAQRMDWGLYRNARCSMAKILLKELKYEQAITFFLEVCYLDLNGPNNCGGEQDRQIRNEYPPFNPKEGTLAPGVLGYIDAIVDKSNGQLTLSEERFIQVATLVCNSLRLPLPPDKAWKKLKREIQAAR
jgi:hypothetical protein